MSSRANCLLDEPFCLGKDSGPSLARTAFHRMLEQNLKMRKLVQMSMYRSISLFFTGFTLLSSQGAPKKLEEGSLSHERESHWCSIKSRMSAVCSAALPLLLVYIRLADVHRKRNNKSAFSRMYCVDPRA